MTSKRPFFSTVSYVVLGRVGGLIIPFLIAYIYGAGEQTDAFFMAFTLILAFSNFIGPVFNSVLIPQLAKYQEEPRKIFQLSNGVVLLGLPAIFLMALILGSVLTPVLGRFSGLGEETAAFTTKLFFEMLPFLIFGVMIVATDSVFYVKKVFWFPAVSSLIRAAFVIGSMLMVGQIWGVHALSRGYALGETLRWVVGIVLIAVLGLWKVDLNFSQMAQDIKEFFKASAIQIPAYVALNLILIIDQWFASWTGEAGVSLLSYGERLYQIPYLIFMTGILPIFFSDWSKKYYELEKPKLWQHILRDIRVMMTVTLGISVGLYLLREPLVGLFYAHGSISEAQLSTISDLFGWFALVLMPAVWHLLYIRILYIMKKSFIFTLQGFFKLALNVILNYIFVQFFGLKGIIMATFVVYLSAAVFLHLYILRNLKKEAQAT